MTDRKRIGIFGWGVVAPKSPNIEAFERNLERADSWLTPFRGYGQSNFLVGEPEFDFETYHDWFDQRFPPAKFSQLAEKMGPMVKFAIGAFIQSLQQNPGIETYLQSLKTRCHVYLGTGLGDITITETEALRRERALRRWNEFWAAPERCSALRLDLEGNVDPAAPQNPDEFSIGSGGWIQAEYAPGAFRAGKSKQLQGDIRQTGADPGEREPP